MSYQRISPIAPPGSLLKSAMPARKRKPSDKRDADYRALIRRCPCLACDKDPALICAHVRMTRAGKPIAGMGQKPDDRWTLPLCQACHTDGKGAQHKVGEVTFWAELGLDPITLCERLYTAAPDIEVMRQICFRAREGRL